MSVASVASHVLLGRVLLFLQPIFRHPSVMQPWQCSGKKKWSLLVSGWVALCDSWTLTSWTLPVSSVLPFLSYVLGEELVTQPQHWPLPACWGLWKAARRNGKEERMSEEFPFLLVQITQGTWNLDFRSSLGLCSTARSVLQSHGAALLLWS